MATTLTYQRRQWVVHLFGDFRLECDGTIVANLGDKKNDLLLAYLAIAPEKAHRRRDLGHAFWPHRDLEAALKRLSYILWQLRRQWEDLGLDDAIIADRATLRLSPWISTDAQEFRALIVQAAALQPGPERVALLQHAVGLYDGGLLPAFQFPWLQQERLRLEAMVQDAIQGLSQPLEVDVGRPIPPPGINMSEGGVSILEIASPSALAPASASASPPALALALASASPPALAPIGESPARPRHLSPTAERERLTRVVEGAEEHLATPDRAFWLTRIDAEYPAVEAALERAITTPARTQGLRLASPLWRYWDARGRLKDGRWFMEQLLSLPGDSPPGVEAKARHCAGVLALREHSLDHAQQHFEAARPLWQADGNEIGAMRTLANLAAVAHSRGEYSTAGRVYAEALPLARRHGTAHDLATLLTNAALTAIRLSDADRARTLLLEGLEIAQAERDEKRAATALLYLASVDLLDGNEDAAATRARQALGDLRAQADTKGESVALRILGRIAHDRGHHAAAITQLTESLAAARTAKDLWETGESLRYLAQAHYAAGEVYRAIEALRQAVGLLESAGDRASSEKARHLLQEIEAGPERPPSSSPAAIRDSLPFLPEDRERLHAFVSEMEPIVAGPDRATWMSRIDAEYDRLRALIQDAIDRQEFTFALQLASPLWQYWMARGKVDEGRRILEQLLGTTPAIQTQTRAKALHAVGTLAFLAGDLDHATKHLEAALPIWWELGDDRNLVKTLSNLAVVANRAGNLQRARQILAQTLSIARKRGDHQGLIARLLNTAQNELMSGDLATARTLLLERLRIAEEDCNDWAIASSHANLATVDLYNDDFASAQERASRALSTFRALGDARWESFALRLLGRVAHDEHRYDEAADLYRQSLDAARLSGDWREIGESLRYLAATAEAVGDIDQATLLNRQAAAMLQSAGDVRNAQKARLASESLEREGSSPRIPPLPGDSSRGLSSLKTH